MVVAGIGAVTSHGVGAKALWEGVRDGRVAIRPVQRMPMDGYRSQLAGEVREEVVPDHDYRRPHGHREPAMDFALKAAEEALESAGIDLDSIPAERWGIVVGTCFAGIRSAEKWYADQKTGSGADPGLLHLALPHALAETMSATFGVKGPVLSIDTACASGANAIGYASDLIRSGEADVVLAGGSDTLCDLNFAGFSAVEALSPDHSAPFSRARRGLNLGEGSGMLVITREDLARQLGAPILAEVAGYGLAADGFHPTAPDPHGEGASRAITEALAVAGVSPEEVRYVNSHGTGTPKNDLAETRAIRQALGDAADRAVVSSTKSMIGHLTGAAGAVEGIVTVQALQEQIAPPTANFAEADPACDLDYAPNAARPLAIAMEQEGEQIKPHAARNDRHDDEQSNVKPGKSRSDGHDLIGDRRQPLEQDDPCPVMRIGFAERLHLVAVAVEIDQPLPDAGVERRADEIAEEPAGDRSDGANRGEEKGPVGPRQRHRNQHHVRRHRKKRALGKGRAAQDPGGMRLAGGVDAPIVQAAEHGRLIDGECGGFKGSYQSGERQRRLRVRRPSSMTILRRGKSSGSFFGTFSAMPRRRSRRSISFQTSSGRMLEATHSTTRL